MAPLKYLINLWKTLEMPLINCDVTLDLNWYENCVIVVTNIADQDATFLTFDTKLYVPVVILSIQDNGFKRTVHWINRRSK